MLPAEYQQVEYLQNGTTEFIKTDYVPPLNQDVRVTFDYALTQSLTNSSNAFFGYINSTGSYKKLFVNCQSGNKWQAASGLLTSDSILPDVGVTIGQKYHGELTYNGLAIDGNADTFSTETTDGNALAIYIFARRRVAGANALTPGLRLYSLKFYNGSTLEADFVPCFRISDGKPGMYDIVSEKFYTNAGSGEFIIGPIASHVSEWLMTRRRGMMRGGGGLPAEYRRVEYLQSSSGQYIDNIPVTFDGQGIDMLVKFQVLERKLYGPYIFSTDSTMLYFVIRNANSQLTRFKINDVNYNSSASPPSDAPLEVSISDGVARMSYSDETMAVSSPVGSSTLTVFAYSGEPAGTTYNAPIRISYLRLKNLDGTGIELIPCVRISDSKPGMYDTVSGTFYTNAGTGEFIAGPDQNLLLPFSEWQLKQSRGTTTIDEQGRLVFNATSNSSWNLYAIMQDRTLTYAEMRGKKYRVTLVVDSISINAGDAGIATGPDFTASANPTSSNQRSYIVSATEYFGGTITEPGEYSYDFVCDTANLTPGSVSFNETDKLGASVFLNASSGSSAVISKLEVCEVL